MYSEEQGSAERKGQHAVTMGIVDDTEGRPTAPQYLSFNYWSQRVTLGGSHHVLALYRAPVWFCFYHPAQGIKPTAMATVLEAFAHTADKPPRGPKRGCAQTGGERLFDATDVYEEISSQSSTR